MLILAAALLAACGVGEQTAGGTAPSEPPSTAAEAAVRATTPSNASASTMRLVTDTAGRQVEIPAEPQRVVDIGGDPAFEAMLALDVPVLAAGAEDGYVAQGFASHLEGLTDGIQPLPWRPEPDLELIATLEPDLIITFSEDAVDTLSGIAPTLVRPFESTEWKDAFRQIAAWFGREQRAEELIDAYETRVAELGPRLEEAVADETVTVVQVCCGDAATLAVDGFDSFSFAVLTEAGLTMSPVTYEAEYNDGGLSFERLPDIDADHIFWQVRENEDGSKDMASVDRARQLPFWDSLSAVRSEHMYFVDNRPWYYPTILSAHQILDDVERYLLAAGS